MNRILILFLFVLTLILTACSDTDTAEEVEAKDESASSEVVSEDELSEIEKENEELKKELAKRENEELKSELEDNSGEDASDSDEDTDEVETSNKNKKKDKEEKDQSSNRSELMFDINAQTTQEQLIGTVGGNEDGTFTQSAITKGMSQTEVEEKYGEYDFTLYTGGTSPAFYGNLAVVYSAYAPAEEVPEAGIDPDENYVEYVWYYADITEAELVDALGEPTDYNAGDKSMNGLPYYVYSGEGDDGRYYSTGASTFESSEGYTISIIKRDIIEEKPNETNNSITSESDESTSADLYFSNENEEIQSYPVTLIESEDQRKYEVFTNYMNDYVPFLTSFYNDESDYVLDYVVGDARNQILSNYESGNFAEHQNLGMDIVSITQLSEDMYEVSIDRTYSHISSGGEMTSRVTYTVIDTGSLLITDFQ